MTNFKIINDPIYGFIQVQRGLVLSLIDHPWYQRLRRIRQGGFSHLVYPGATHTRFHHSLGAYHLAYKTMQTLQLKGVNITNEESEALTIALLLHDIGHGPFSHSLEYQIVDQHHEALTQRYLQALNDTYDGALDLAIAMFEDRYHRPLFHQLISSDLDLDRMDYLARDSYYTGVSEGVIGYDRLIHMFNVVDDELVVEEKGLTSVEKFVLARQLMYRQVYYHKMVASSECMLRRLFRIIHDRLTQGADLPDMPIIGLMRDQKAIDDETKLERFSTLDDSDVIVLLKALLSHENAHLRLLADGLINRHLFKYETIEYDHVGDLADYVRPYNDRYGEDLVILVQPHRRVDTPNSSRRGIKVLMKDGTVKNYEELMTQNRTDAPQMAYLCRPKAELI